MLENNDNVFIDGIIFSIQHYGGISVYWENILTRLTGVNNAVALFSNPQRRFSNIFTKSYDKRLLERYRSCRVPLERYEVFHSSYYRLPDCKIPTITTVHDFVYERYVKGRAQKIHSWQKNRAILNSDFVICISQNTAKDLLKYCPIPEKKIRIVYNGVSDEYYPIASSCYSQDVLFVGGRKGYKNFLFAIQAVAAKKELRLHIVGGGKLSKKEIQVLDHYLPNRYSHDLFLSTNELNELYNNAYCLLYPSLYEGFGIPVLEAMQAGCPVIAMNSSSLPEVAGDAALLLEDLNVDSACDALSMLEGNFRMQLRAKGFIQSSKFSWEKCFQETMSVYNLC